MLVGLASSLSRPSRGHADGSPVNWPLCTGTITICWRGCCATTAIRSPLGCTATAIGSLLTSVVAVTMGACGLVMSMMETWLPTGRSSVVLASAPAGPRYSTTNAYLPSCVTAMHVGGHRAELETSTWAKWVEGSVIGMVRMV